MQAEATPAMSRYIATAFTAVVLATGLVTGVASGGTAPGKLPPTNLTLPTISGAAQVGGSLTADPGTWSGKSVQFAYGWLRCDSSGPSCSSIAGATGRTLELSSTYVGARVRVVVIGTNRNGSVATTSAATPAVVSASTAPPPPPPPPPPSYLSDLSWASMTNGWGPAERNLSNGEQAQGDGHAITLNGETFSKGLGGHAGSSVRYMIGGCTRFAAVVGVDDEVGSGGSVVFEAYLDGAKVYDSGLMTGGTASRPVDLDTTGKSELRLVIGNGGDNINSDHGDWASARLTCASPPPSPPPATLVTSPSVTSAPAISGTAQQGLTLTASSGTWAGTTPMTYSYQWQRCDSGGAACSAVAGATGAAYVPVSADLGKTMRVSVTATNSAGSATASSAATGAVGALPSAQAPVTGAVTYGKSFEDGLILSGGWGVQDSTNVADTSGIHRGKVGSDNSTSEGGAWSGRFDLPAYPGGRTAAELLHSRMANPGTDDYYSEAFKFADFAWGDCQNQALSLAQYNYQGVAGSPLALSAQCGTSFGATATNLKSVFLLVNSGNCTTTSGCPYYSGGPVGGGFGSRGVPDPGPYYILPPGNVQLNVWYQVVVHVKWTAGLDGVVEAWVRQEGSSTFIKAFSHVGGFPTLQWGGPNNVAVSSLSNYGTNDKIGVYRGPDASPLRLWQDSFCRATTFNAAASCLS
jgi:hypothetical protein